MDKSKAICTTVDPELFFPLNDTSAASLRDIDLTRALCSACPLQRACLDYAYATNQGFGTWGGVTEWERRGQIRRYRVQLKAGGHELVAAMASA